MSAVAEQQQQHHKEQMIEDKMMAPSPAEPTSDISVDDEFASSISLDSISIYPSAELEVEVQDLPWDELSDKVRMKCLLNFMEVISKRKDDVALSIVDDMNKPIAEARAEVAKCISHIQISCDLLRKTDSLKETIEPHPCDLKNSLLMKRLKPFGSILVISPWNYPLWLPFKTIIAALLMGNTVVHRPSSTCNKTSQLLKELIDNSELPNSVWRVGDKCTYSEVEHYIKSIDCQGVSFTGSTEVGKIVAQHAASELKPMVLELGGSDLMIISEDYVDYREAANVAMRSRCLNNGQVCIATKRVCLYSLEALGAFIKELEVVIKDHIVKADSKDEPRSSEQITLTQLSNKSHFDRCVKQVSELVKEDGVNVAYGDLTWLESAQVGNVGDLYFPPFVVTNVDPSSKFWNEEEFMCPVLMVSPPENYNHVIESASSPGAYFGLGGTVFLSNAKVRELRKRNSRWGPCSPSLLFKGSAMRSGMMSINSQFQSHSLIPFGGVNNSGIGKECGIEGFRSFTYVQCISIPKASDNDQKSSVKKRIKMPKAVGTTTSKISKKVMALTKIGTRTTKTPDGPLEGPLAPGDGIVTQEGLLEDTVANSLPKTDLTAATNKGTTEQKE